MREFLRISKPSDRGFTLIELLIVVAIIAILAAIAVPNFLQAQVRSKVSRVLSDQRTLRTAIESYAVDNNRPPRMTWGDLTGEGFPGMNDQLYGEPVYATLPKEITTPISYITSQPFDPFAANTSASVDAQLYTYNNPETNLFLFDNVGTVPVPGKPGYVYIPGNRQEVAKMRFYFGSYVLWSIGPAGPEKVTGPNFWLQYDPTNGTISEGHVFVSQKYTAPTYNPPF